MKKPLFPRLILASSIALALAACGGGGGNDDPAPEQPAPEQPAPEQPAPQPPTPQPPAPEQPAPGAANAFAVTASNRLISFDRAAPSTAVLNVAITGLEANEAIHDIDFRPSNGQLYGLTSLGRIITIDTTSGAATAVSTLRPVNGDTDPFTALNGANYGIDFDPVPLASTTLTTERLRVTSNTGENYRVNVETGEAFTQALVSGANVTDLAFTNSFAAADTSRVGYFLDAEANTLGVIAVDTGVTSNAVPLNIDFDAVNAFDIDGRNNQGLAALNVGGTTSLYTIQLPAVGGQTANVAATPVGALGGGEAIRGLAIPTPVPTVHALTADNRLFTFDARSPSTATPTAITGVAEGQTVVGIDVNPGNGQLYGVTSGGSLITIAPATGAATVVAALTANPEDTSQPFGALDGTAFDIDFNPTNGGLRVVSNTGQNLVVDVANGLVTTAPTLNRTDGTPQVTGAAYSNNYAGATGTNLRVIDSGNSTIYQQSLFTGALTSPVALRNVTATGDVGFDIAGGQNGLSLGAFNVSGQTSLYRVAFGGGAVTPINEGVAPAATSTIGDGSIPVRDIAINLR